MSWLYQWMGALTTHLRPHLDQIAIAAVATLLVIYGDSINASVKRQIRSLHFVWRTLIFVLLCAFGYGAMMVFIAPLLAAQLKLIPALYLPGLLLLLFIGLGVLADRKRQI